DLVRASFYGIANLYYEFLEGTHVLVSGTRIGSTSDRVWGSLGIGGALSWNDRTAIYGEFSARASLASPGDSYSYKGIAGFRFKW
ncbi:autotransporter outer membrane beta-barrel domain-containing protein, partial [Vineibacter terrae]|uniref:autotransporter outer membrane beta-barrel domain-containing protein n=1 Tax=Vineibacter terrae TaxID=2586908 RepID=UPI002E35CD1B